MSKVKNQFVTANCSKKLIKWPITGFKFPQRLHGCKFANPGLTGFDQQEQFLASKDLWQYLLSSYFLYKDQLMGLLLDMGPHVFGVALLF